MMKNEVNEKEKITAKKMIKILKSGGIHVTLEEAVAILVFMKKIANMAVSKYLQI